ncbi:MAG TPA: sulfatase-like hydrolase/transferase [Polyangiaceae bacterium]
MAAARSARHESIALECAAVAVAWLALLFVETVVVGLAWGRDFSAAWEVSQVRRLVVPMAFAGLAPVSLVVVGWWRVARLAARRAWLSVAAIRLLGGVAGAALAAGVSTGRHFANPLVRAGFVLVIAVACTLAASWVAIRIARFAARPGALAVLAGVVAACAWAADVFVVPRLYPAFHVALLVATLSATALVGLATAAGATARPRTIAAMATPVLLLAIAAMAWTPGAARRLDRFDNVRLTLVERAPLLGRAVQLELLSRRRTDDDGAPPPAASAADAPADAARTLDWTGHDVLLLSIDALRADHVGAYGYARPTTPSIDALAADGTLFEAAYCPTPHTSYSVTSMMTGKYLRPLLALGLGEDSDTWAQDLRLYGWRTAAFYPPAVFYIDEDRFPRFEQQQLGFEYAKVEFADPALREQQVAGYLQTAPRDKPLFLWVHFFEPHEPYVIHEGHVFGKAGDVDSYDSEVATADEGVGRIVRLMRDQRPGAVVMVTADHGEEFGEHGGRYHGTTVYEEQVRVPLVVVGPGVKRGAHVSTVVQTIDLLPTTLSALGIPRPPRVRGRDLGKLLAGQGSDDPGFAFAETDGYALVASGPDRLVCERRAAACALYRPEDDPGEQRDRSAEDVARFMTLKADLHAVERDQGRYETAGGPAWPEALRRGIMGDPDAAIDVASLLDDADVGIRRKAAEVCFALRSPLTAPYLRRALAHDEDREVRRWSLLALVRIGGETVPPAAEVLLSDPSRDWRRRAALTLAERGSNFEACDVLAAWWKEVVPATTEQADGEPAQLGLDLAHAQELLGATGKARCRAAVPSLLRALADVRARPYVAEALGRIGDDRARGPLKALLATEPYVTTRPYEARALLALGTPDPTGALKAEASR